MKPVILENFKNALTDIVRPNRFLVEIVPPSSIEDAIPTDRLMYFATSASLPDRNFNEVIIKFYGMDYKIPASEVTQDLIINFIVDESWGVRSLFEAWASLINDRETTEKADIVELLDGSYVKVHQLDNTGNKLQSYEFRYAFPKTMDQIDLNQETMDGHETFQVTFSYSYWVGIDSE